MRTGQADRPGPLFLTPLAFRSPRRCVDCSLYCRCCFVAFAFSICPVRARVSLFLLTCVCLLSFRVASYLFSLPVPQWCQWCSVFPLQAAYPRASCIHCSVALHVLTHTYNTNRPSIATNFSELHELPRLANGSEQLAIDIRALAIEPWTRDRSISRSPSLLFQNCVSCVR